MMIRSRKGDRICRGDEQLPQKRLEMFEGVGYAIFRILQIFDLALKYYTQNVRSSDSSFYSQKCSWER